MSEQAIDADVIIIGAGPSGSTAAACLQKKGISTCVLEKEHFPRFSIGESLLPQCMGFLEKAGLLTAVQGADFQIKNGAAFEWQGNHTSYDFADKFSSGMSTTYHVKRGDFDKILADGAAELGADIHYGATVTQLDISKSNVEIRFETDQGNACIARGQFCLDASGFGRILPRHLNLERPSRFPVRTSLFTHAIDRISTDSFDRNKILITVHPDHRDVWFWLIPFSDGTCSIGVVGLEGVLNSYGETDRQRLINLVGGVDHLSMVLQNAEYHQDVSRISGYSANVTTLHGPGFALLGNAAEFIDPVFSSGVTIALKSAYLAAEACAREIGGEDVDWQKDFAEPLQRGVNTFRSFVEAWYDGRLHDIIFYPSPSKGILSMIIGVLAGYAWDEDNPLVAQTERRLNVLAQICASGNHP